MPETWHRKRFHYRSSNAYELRRCCISWYTTTVHKQMKKQSVILVVMCTFDISQWPVPSSRELWTLKFKSHLLRTQSLKVLSLKPGVAQCIAIHVMLTDRDFFLADFFPFAPFTCFFFQNLSQVFPVLAVSNKGSCVGLHSKIGHLAGCRFLCCVSTEYRWAPTRVAVFLGFQSKLVDMIWVVFQEKGTCGMNNLEFDWSLFSVLMYSFVVDWVHSTN